MVLILFVQVLKKVLKSLKFELKYPGGTLIKHYITSRFPKLGFVKELQGGCEFNERLTIKS